MLTDRIVSRAKTTARIQRLSDGDGLCLLLEPGGRRWWRFDYVVAGVRKTISFGVYPDVGLVEARERRREARALVRSGHDPSVVRKRERLVRSHAARQTFEQVADEWIGRQAGKLDPASVTRHRTVMRLHVYPAIGDRPIGAIEPPELLTVFHAIEHRGLRDTAHRAKQTCGQIFRYAIVTGRATRDPAADLKGALLPVLVESHAAVTEPKAVGALLAVIDEYDGLPSVRAALRLLPLLFVRPGELRRMEWREVDLPGAVWRLPRSKMKMRAAHLVPLPRQAVALLEDWQRRAPKSPHVFPSPQSPKRPLSDMTLGAALRRLGYGSHVITPHGFRAMARTLLDERLRFAPDVIEVQLAHVVRGPLGDTYNRSKYLEERTRMMQAYADYLDHLKSADHD